CRLASRPPQQFVEGSAAMTIDKRIFEPEREWQYDFEANAPTPWRTSDEVDRYVPTHCCYCGVQCAMYLKVANGRVVGVEPRYDFPYSHGMLCPKGTTAYQTIHHPDRLTHPLIRHGGKGGRMERASWDEALDLVARRFQEIQAAHGQDAVAVYSGSSMINEKC